MRQVREMVLQFRNHPSIVIWSISNEPFFTQHAQESRELCSRLIALVKELDPTRPVCAGRPAREFLTNWGTWPLSTGTAHVREDARKAQHGDGIRFRELQEAGSVRAGLGGHEEGQGRRRPLSLAHRRGGLVRV